MSEDTTGPAGPACPSCQNLFMPWITTCPQCDIPLASGFEATPLAEQVAPRILKTSSWIDIAVASEEPVKVALLTNFLTERDIEFEQSRRFVSVPAHYSEQLEEAIEVWAFTQDLPEDDRHHDSLAATLRHIGNAVLNAVHGTHNSALPRNLTSATVAAVDATAELEAARRIDLRQD